MVASRVSHGRGVLCRACAGVCRASTDLGENPNPALFPTESHTYGAGMSTWADRESQWAYVQPLAQDPVLDQTGAHRAVGQAGPVWFLPPDLGPPVFSGSRTCTIPAHTAVLLEIGAYVNPWPCPDPNFRPAPGQSLYDFPDRRRQRRSWTASICSKSHSTGRSSATALSGGE
jgi:hypothetical protein